MNEILLLTRYAFVSLLKLSNLFKKDRPLKLDLRLKRYSHKCSKQVKGSTFL
jgi:hypothetical protein